MSRGKQFAKEGKQADAAIQYQKALQKDPEYGDAYFQLGLLLAEQGKSAEAIVALRKAEQLLPRDPSVKAKLANIALTQYLGDPRRPRNLYELIDRIGGELLVANARSFDGLRLKGYLAMTSSKPADAVRFLKQAVEVNTNAPDVCVVLVQNLILDGQAPEAEAAGKKFLSAHPSYGPLYDVLYSHYMSTGRSADAEAVLQSKVDRNPQQLYFAIQLAQHYRDSGKTTQMAALIDRLIANPKDFPRAPLEVGDLYTKLQDWPQAVRMYELGIQRAPGEKALYEKRIASALIGQGKAAEAAALLDSVLKSNPGDSEARSSRAALRMASRQPGEVDQAVLEFRSLLDKDPENIEYRLSLARGYLQSGQEKAALKEYQEVIRRKPDHFEALTELAGTYIQAQEAGPALRYAERALAYGSANPAARLVRTAAWALQGRYAEIRPELVLLLKEYPNLKQAKLQMAMLLVAEKKYVEAERLFRAYYSPGQGDVGSLRGLVALYMEQGMPGKALVAVQQEYAALPASAAVRSLLVTTAMASGDIRLATEVAEKSVASEPGSPEAALQLGTLYQRQGRLDKAIELFRQAAALDSKSGAPPAMLGDALVEAGKPADAIAAYRQSLRLDPANPATMNNLAFQLADTGRDLDEAASLAQRAAQQLSDNPSVIDTMGYIYLKQNRYDSALQTLRRAVALAPRSAGFRVHLAMALLAKGDRGAARKELQDALSAAASGSRDAARAKQLLGGL